MSRGDSINNEGRACGRVARGKYACTAGGKCIWINSNRPLARNPHAAVLGDEGETRTLTDGKDNHVAVKFMFAIWHGFKRQRTI